MHVLTHGEGTSAARGTFAAGKVPTAIYASTIKSRKKTDRVRVTLDDGDVKDFKADPPQDHDHERVPVTEAHRHGVFDPMTASLTRVPGTGEAAFAGSLPAHDGDLRRPACAMTCSLPSSAWTR